MATCWEYVNKLEGQLIAQEKRNTKLTETLETAVFWLEGCVPHTEHTDHIWEFIAKARAVLDKEGE